MGPFSRRIVAFVLGCACFAVSGGPMLAFPLSSELRERTAQASNEDDERTRYVLRALSPHDPPNVEGLRQTGVGTGFFVAPQVVLTNFHVAGNCKALTVGNNTEGEEVAAVFRSGDSADDLAILLAEDASAKPAQFQMALDEETGAGLAIVGYPEHGLPVIQAELDPVIASPDDLVADRAFYPFAGAVRRGNSGSPVLDGHGAVLGMVRAKIDTVATYRATGNVVDNIGFAISNATILAFLQSNSVAFEPSAQQVSLSPEQLLHDAHDFVRQIGCWN